MIQLFNLNTGEPLITNDELLPLPGLYYSIVTEAYTAVISPLHNDEDTCFVVERRLVSVDTLEECMLTETFYPYRSNPRSDKFFSYLHKHFPIPYGEDEAIIGLREKLEINWDILGGHAYPVVARRWFIDLPQAYKENYLSEQEEEDMED